jgi:CMP-N,N'-diacetyllegionaminic acid synthase
MNSKDIKILGVIPARAGSKGVPGKNIRMLAGKPLIAYTIESALKSSMITDVVVSTDSEEIKTVAEQYGVEVPFLRPAALASDTALAVPTIQHALQEMEQYKKVKYDYVAMLQPTSPLKTAEDIDAALNQLIKEDADGIISVVTVDNNHPMKMKKFLGEGGKSGLLVDYEAPPYENCPRQFLPPVFMVNGALYATKRDVFMEIGSFKGNKCIGYIMPMDKSVNIDTELDFILAEHMLKNLNK